MSDAKRASSQSNVQRDTSSKPATLSPEESLVRDETKGSSSLFPLLPPSARSSPFAAPSLSAESSPSAASSPIYWNAGIGGVVTNYGASCTLSCFRSKVELGDFSHISVAVINEDPSHGQQSIQAGWIRARTGLQGASDAYDKDLCQLFVYFTTTGSAGGPEDFVKGFNDYQQGWEGFPDTFQPGVGVLPGSIIGGAQRSVDLKFQLAGDRWNLRMNGTIIGYYPTSLFTTDRRDPANPPLEDVSKTLADHATRVVFYGQVLDASSGITSTEMGSGKFAEEGYQRSAFVGKMQYQPKPTAVNPAMVDADDSWDRIMDDPDRYNCLVSWKSSSVWKSYMYLGGPGCMGTGWSSWESAGGYFQAPNSSLTAISRKSGVIDLFIVGTDGKVYTSWWEDGNWSGYNNDWRPLDWGGGQKFLNLPNVVAVARSPDNLDIFVIGDDYAVYWAKWSEDHDWTGWTNLSTKQSISQSPPPLLAAVSRDTDQLDVFVMNSGNILNSSWTEGVTAWTGMDGAWLDLGSPPGIPLFFNMLVLSRDPDTLDIITSRHPSLSETDFVCMTYSNGSWSGFNSVGTAAALTPTPIAGVTRNGRIDLFAMGSDFQMYTTHMTAAGVWAGVPDKWAKIGDPNLTSFSNINSIAAVSRKESVIDIFVAGMGGEVYTSSLATSIAGVDVWTAWESRGGQKFEKTTSFGMAACNRNEQTMAVFGLDNVGKVWVSEWLDPICGPRPFYCLAHNPNEFEAPKDEVDISLSMGANALGPDVNKAPSGKLVVAHGPGTGGEASETDPDFVTYLGHLHQMAITHPQLALVAFDCKPATHDKDIGYNILMAIRQNLTYDLPLLNIILSVPHLPDAPKLFERIAGILGPREAIAIDEEADVKGVAVYYAGARATSHAAYGNGISIDLLQDPIFRPTLRRSIEQAVGFHAGQASLQSVYVWTMNDGEYQKEYIRIGANGVMSDIYKNLLDDKPGLQRLVEQVTTDPEMCRHVRLATRDDPLLPGPPAAYELTVQTGSTGAAGTDGRLTFTIRGVLGVCKKTVDTSLRGGIPGIGADGRMESGGTDYVVIYSQDLGELVELTVFNDMSHSLLGNSRWRCESVRVQSALYEVDKTATFGADIDNTPVTRPLN